MFLKHILNNLVDVKCEHCKEKLTFENLQSNGIITCVKCNKQNDLNKLAQTLNTLSRKDSSHFSYDKSISVPSEKIKQYYSEGGQVIERDWSSPGRGFITTFAVLWNVFITAFVSIFAFAAGSGSKNSNFDYSSIPILAIFALVFGGVGVLMAYKALQVWFNSTKLYLNNYQIRVESGPILFGNKVHVFNRQDIDNMSVEKFSVGSENKRPVYSYRLNFHLKSGNTHIVFAHISREDAVAIEKIFEGQLNLKDKPHLDVA